MIKDVQAKNKLDTKTKELSKQWLDYERRRVETMNNYILYFSNMMMYYNANILSNGDGIMAALKNIHPSTLVSVGVS